MTLIRTLAFALLSAGVVSRSARADETKASGAAALMRRVAKADRIEVFSLDAATSKGKAGNGERRFHGYEVLGSVTLDGRDEPGGAEIKAILAALDKTLADPTPNTGKGCVFTPRHGLRIRSAGTTIDLVVCLECGDVDVGEKRYWLQGSEEKESLRRTLNGPLKRAGVTLAKGVE